ncbi:MAG: hypothetical protein K5883_04590 [Pseudobutyrivibrio sp.]|nr:hypothetical protein [Pseudobutyrivibrio sp.]
MKNSKKLIIALLAVAIIIICLLTAYFIERKKCYVEPTEITYSVGGGDIYSYTLYSIKKDTLTYYDFTQYGLDHDYKFNYYTDPLPPEGDYEMKEWKMKDGSWDKIVATLQNNLFIEYPDTVGPVVMDGGYTGICVVTDDEIYHSSAYVNMDSKGLRYNGFKRICKVITEAIDDAN